MVYAKHYAPKAKEDTTYFPPTSYMRANLAVRPVCRTKGRLDVTSDIHRVTCGACKARMVKMGIDLTPVPVVEDAVTVSEHEHV